LKLLLVGEHGPGALSRSLLPGLSQHAEVVAVDPYASGSPRQRLARLRSYRGVHNAGAAFAEAVDQLRPDAALVIKGQGLDAADIERIRDAGVAVTVFYPDNPFWEGSQVLERLAAADCAVVWSDRLAALLRPRVRCAEVMAFGYDERWFAGAAQSGDRTGIVFLGTWSPRRERYLSALRGLPVTIHGTGWASHSALSDGDPVTEMEGGRLLASAAIGVNLLHPQCAGAHNMRTREITGAGALELTDVGCDQTPLRDGRGARWFRSPAELRALAEHFLGAHEEAADLAAEGQALTAADTYTARAAELVDIVAGPLA
jgi:hypothetical protein